MKPKTYPLEKHKIKLSAIDSKALYILEKLQASGFIAYLVGGGVRDLLLDKKPKDFDIATSAKPEEIKPLFSSAILIGKRFRLAHIRFGRKVIEVSTFRAGNIENEELITEDNLWGTPKEDALRRDFTINALFYDSADQTIIDYVGGYEDIQKKCLRAIGQPYLRFKQDPVRMIRCLKFEARFGLEVEKEARLALVECKADILKSAKPRILEELLRMLESGSAAPFFKLMTDHGILQELLPTVAQFLEERSGAEIYNYLQEADMIHKEPASLKLKRPILITCLLYPLFQRHLKIHFTDCGKAPHLGQVSDEAHSLIDLAFQTSLHLPRRLKMSAVSILVSQYRITPFEKRKKRAIRVPRSLDFPLALQFFSLRARLEPGLQEMHERWSEVYQNRKKFNKRSKAR